MSKLFPELAGPGDTSAEPAATTPRAAASSGIQSRGPSDGRQGGAVAGAVAGAASVARLAELFRLGDRLQSARRSGDREIELTIDLGAHGVALVTIGPRGAPSWMDARDFAIRYKGKDPHPALEQAMRRFVLGHRNVPLDAILALVVPNAEDADMLPWDDPDTLVYSYGTSKAWRMFFEPSELYRGVCGRFGGNLVEVSHNELECHYNQVARGSNTISFFNSVRVTETEGDPGTPYLVSDLQDLDVIRGGDVKLDQVLDSITSLEERPALVIVGSTCVPIVTGDDLDASASRAEKKLGLPVLVAGNHNDPGAVLLERMLDDPTLDHAERRAGAINLVGIPPIVGFDDAVALLEESGIDVNAILMPHVEPAALRRFGAADLIVQYPWDRSEDAAALLIRRFGLPAITPPAPFGMEGSRRWLFAIADALGRREAAERAWEARAARHAKAWTALCAKARSYRLGFVLADARWRETLAAERSMGVPICDVLTEMGFGLDLLVYARRPARDAPASDGRVRVAQYGTAGELEALVRASTAVAFYSEMYFDRRLTRTGKSTFSLQDFQLGTKGALATLTRLLAACRLPYYRMYASLLGEPFTPTGENA